VIQTQVRSSASVRTILAIFSALFGVGWTSLNFAPVVIETLQQGRGLSATAPALFGWSIERAGIPFLGWASVSAFAFTFLIFYLSVLYSSRHR
jgi:hypothetical protein